MRKKAELILHAGMPKTGSTSIQAVLKCPSQVADLEAGGCRALTIANDVFMRDIGLAAVEELHDDRLSNMGMYLNAVLNRPRHRGPEAIQRLRRSFSAELRTSIQALPTSMTMIISAEAAGSAALDMATLLKLRTFLERWFSKMRVIVYVREPLSYALSRLQQSIKLGQPRENGLRSALRSCHQASAITNFRELFGYDNVTVRSFDSALLAGEDVRIDFFEQLLGPKKITLKPVAQTTNNLSLTNEMVCFLESLSNGGSIPRSIGWSRLIGSVRWAGTKYSGDHLTFEQHQQLISETDAARENLLEELSFEPFPSFKPLSRERRIEEHSATDREAIDLQNLHLMKELIKSVGSGDLIDKVVPNGSPGDDLMQYLALANEAWSRTELSDATARTE